MGTETSFAAVDAKRFWTWRLVDIAQDGESKLARVGDEPCGLFARPASLCSRRPNFGRPDSSGTRPALRSARGWRRRCSSTSIVYGFFLPRLPSLRVGLM